MKEAKDALEGAMKQKIAEDETAPPPTITEETRSDPHFNKHDGLLHNQDGSLDTLDGQRVRGVNVA